MSAVISISTGKAYGVSRVCRAWSPNRASVYRDLQPARTEAAPPPGTTRPPVGCRSGRGDQTGHHQQQVPWRGLSQGVGAPALQGHPHLESAGSAADARERALCEAMSGAAHGPRAHDGTIIPGNIDERPRDVGHRHDRHPPEHRASGRGPCRGRSLIVRRAAWAFMQPSGAHASRRCSRSAGACGTASERAPRTWPLA